jgi:hypothetical protein
MSDASTTTTIPTTAMAATSAAPTSTTPSFAAPQAPVSSWPMEVLTTAIYGLQRQMSQIATGLSADERPASSPALQIITTEARTFGMLDLHSVPQSSLSAVPTTSTIVHAASSRPVSITEIQFPHLPSPNPFAAASPSSNQGAMDDEERGLAVPRFHKLSFPTYDGKDDPLGWLNQCDHFFRAQHTKHSDRVWLASFHMTGVAQHWYNMLERDAGVLQWS